jgi:hypothetical protein
MSLIRIHDEDRWIESRDVTSVAIADSKVIVTLRSGTEVYLPCKPGNSVSHMAEVFVNTVNDSNRN